MTKQIKPTLSISAKKFPEGYCERVAEAVPLIHSYRLDCKDCLRPDCKMRESKAPITDEERADLERKSIEDVGFSIRIAYALKTAGINTVGDLCKSSVSDLIRLRRVGRKAIAEVRLYMERHGLELPEEGIKNSSGLQSDVKEERVHSVQDNTQNVNDEGEKKLIERLNVLSLFDGRQIPESDLEELKEILTRHKIESVADLMKQLRVLF